MKHLKVGLIGLLFSSFVQAAPVYVGSYNVFDGPVWTSNPTVLSALEAAALIFGGSASDYAISVDSNTTDPLSITHTAWLDGWGDTTYLFTPAAETFSSASRADGGYDQYPSFSAYVCDHADCAAYGNPISSGHPGYSYTNYVWRVTSAVPETGSLALMLGGLMLVAATRRYQR